jgi:hypothetical protein
MKLLNIYGQYDNHTEARIIGNREGLEALKEIIERALRNGKASNEQAGSHINPNQDVIGESEALFASDGEGYEVIIEMHNGRWGLEPDGKYNKKRYWNSDKVKPWYLMWQIMEAVNKYQTGLGLEYFAGELTIGKKV